MNLCTGNLEWEILAYGFKPHLLSIPFFILSVRTAQVNTHTHRCTAAAALKASVARFQFGKHLHNLAMLT